MLLTNNPDKGKDPEQQGIEVVEVVPIVEMTANEHNEGYMKAKAQEVSDSIIVHEKSPGNGALSTAKKLVKACSTKHDKFEQSFRQHTTEPVTTVFNLCCNVFL